MVKPKSPCVKECPTRTATCKAEKKCKPFMEYEEEMKAYREQTLVRHQRMEDLMVLKSYACKRAARLCFRKKGK